MHSKAIEACALLIILSSSVGLTVWGMFVGVLAMTTGGLISAIVDVALIAWVVRKKGRVPDGR